MTIEVPRLRLGGTGYYMGRLTKRVTKSRQACTYHLVPPKVGEVEGYMELLRARQNDEGSRGW
ncbi:hypothetical protein [Streptomyces sp. NPDC019890]|uniref:hypothetical protein n=1 Tax=Streptomyces sp. NPDC019890 TaxID=3365064 RepID=UPI00384B06A8